MPEQIKARAKEAMRLELANAALDVVLARGFDDLTVEEIAAAIGMSRATFFRQFGSKEGAVVAGIIGPVSRFSEGYRASANERCASRWGRLHASLEPYVAFAERNRAHMSDRVAFLAEHPAITAKLRQERMPQIFALADAMVEDGEAPFAARIMANAAIATLDHCLLYWVAKEGRDLRALLKEAFTALSAGSRQPESIATAASNG